MNKEEQEAFELVKEFLKTNGYKGTLECLEKEDSYKSVTEKKSKVKFNFIKAEKNSLLPLMLIKHILYSYN